MSTRRLTDREGRIAILCAIIILSYLSYNLVIKPLKDKSENLDTQIETAINQLKKNMTLLEKTGGINNDYNEYQNNFRQTKSNEQVMSSILNEIEKVAAELKLKISDLKPKRVKKEEYFNHFSVSLTIDSDFKDIVQFLYILQRDPHLFKVEELRFDKTTQRNTTAIKTTLVLDKILIPK